MGECAEDTDLRARLSYSHIHDSLTCRSISRHKSCGVFSHRVHGKSNCPSGGESIYLSSRFTRNSIKSSMNRRSTI
ncbi:hypothetical protein RHSP_83473 [Rhizobium freirei PRF 81]|uniref:Uncharacterized protein n=2 Tax=Rhizobium TaxID=379 RepID=N6UAB4_9HYPH|nr:hypothetical protein RTCIAT899_PB02555 [Rhizobium tropici CIAT 899]ENN87133.1 hypothetical protein RHSP_83473 [Rhizobium freirei PRF 81]NEV14885.1 hypothetical protein [Rhizobium tropici]TGE89995.1 hypothetical protein C9417_29490 [Rhizobium sp. SEMIA 4088]